MKRVFTNRKSRGKGWTEDIWMNAFPGRQTASPLRLTVYAFGESLMGENAEIVQKPTDDAWMLKLITAGDGELVNGGQTKNLSPGTAILLLPGMNKMLLRCTGEQLKCVYLLMERNLFMEQAFAPLGELDFPVTPLDDPARTLELFRRLNRTALDGGEYLDADLSVLVYSLLLEVERNLPLKTQPDDRFATTLQKIRHAPRHYKTLASLVREFGLSRKKLYAVFHEKLGMSPVDYVIRQRLDNSCWMLTHQQTPVAEIARLAGYDNVPFYIRSFKRHFGMTPGEYRAHPPDA